MGALVLFSLLLFSDLLCLRFYPFFHWAMKKKKEKQKKVTLRGQATNLLALIRLFPLFRPFLSIKKKGSPQALNIQIFIVIIFNTGPQRSWFKCALIWYPVMGECGAYIMVPVRCDRLRKNGMKSGRSIYITLLSKVKSSVWILYRLNLYYTKSFSIRKTKKLS